MPASIAILLHATLGSLGILASVWLLVETLNASENNLHRIRRSALLAMFLFWLAFVVGGYMYILDYPLDKGLIKAGPWPWAHSVVMETKEHVFLILLTLATFSPIAARRLKPDNIDRFRQPLLITAALATLLGLMMEGAGAVVAMGARLGLF